MQIPVNIFTLILASFLGMLIHLLSKITKTKKMSNGEYPTKEFFKNEWPYMLISLCTIAILILCQRNIAELEIAGKQLGNYMLFIYAILGWCSDSILYNLFGSLEGKITQQLKDKAGV